VVAARAAPPDRSRPEYRSKQRPYSIRGDQIHPEQKSSFS
jgi:hypothetical protein